MIDSKRLFKLLIENNFFSTESWRAYRFPVSYSVNPDRDEPQPKLDIFQPHSRTKLGVDAIRNTKMIASF